MIVSLQNAIRIRDLIFYLCRVLSFKSLSMFRDVTSHSKTIAIDRQSSSNPCVIFSHLRRNIASNVEHDSLTSQISSLFSQDGLSMLLILKNFFRSSYFVIFYVQSRFVFLIMLNLPRIVRRFLNWTRLRVHIVGDNYGILSL